MVMDGFSVMVYGTGKKQSPVFGVVYPVGMITQNVAREMGLYEQVDN